MPRDPDTYRAAFRGRHAKTRAAMRRSSTKGAIALDALNPPKAPTKVPLGNREARRRLRRETRRELRELEKGE